MARRAWRVLLGGMALVLLLPGDAWAWGPSTHVLLGSHVLANLPALPIPVRELLGSWPYEFLYGNLSADITLAKKYVQYSRHCHRWEMGLLLLARAETDRLKSFALGYLSHLAADTLAHNHYVPRQLLVTSSTTQFGHAYWEHRFDAHLPPEHLRRAREIVVREHDEPDQLLEAVLTQAIFSFRTNKRIFSRMIHLSNDERWQGLFDRVVAQSRWDLPEDDVERYLQTTRHFVMDFLAGGVRSRAFGLDPIGTENLALAKKVRRRTIRHSRQDSGRILDLRRYPADVQDMAERFFALPVCDGSDCPRDEAAGSSVAYWDRFSVEDAIPA